MSYFIAALARFCLRSSSQPNRLPPPPSVAPTDILYVTTAAKFDQPAPAGTTYKVTGLNATGYPGVNLKV